MSFSDWAWSAPGLVSVTQLRLIASAGLILLTGLLRWRVLGIVYRRVMDPRDRYRWHKGATSLTALHSVLLLTRVWLVDLGGFATYLGLLSAGLAIALKDPLANSVVCIFIIWRRPFEVSDRLKVGELAGGVVDIGCSSSPCLRSATGCRRTRRLAA